MGWSATKVKILKALTEGTYLHEARSQIDDKNLLAIGDVTVEEVRRVIETCNGTHHQESPHHQVPALTVHILRRSGWYIKFYFVDPDTVFISVHH